MVAFVTGHVGGATGVSGNGSQDQQLAASTINNKECSMIDPAEECCPNDGLGQTGKDS